MRRLCGPLDHFTSTNRRARDLFWLISRTLPTRAAPESLRKTHHSGSSHTRADPGQASYIQPTGAALEFRKALPGHWCRPGWSWCSVSHETEHQTHMFCPKPASTNRWFIPEAVSLTARSAKREIKSFEDSHPARIRLELLSKDSRPARNALEFLATCSRPSRRPRAFDKPARAPPPL